MIKATPQGGFIICRVCFGLYINKGWILGF